MHLQPAAEGWLAPGRNPFGVYLYTPRVDDCVAAMRDAIIAPGKRAEHKPWGMYEVALNAGRPAGAGRLAEPAGPGGKVNPVSVIH